MLGGRNTSLGGAWPVRWRGLVDALAARLAAERDRWVLWLPVAVGAGIAAYFALPSEPRVWLGPAILALSLAGMALARRRPALFALYVGLAAAALGFSVASRQTAAVAAPVLARPTGMIAVEGRIAEIEPMESGQRIILDQLRLPPLKGEAASPSRIRLHLPADIAVAPGQRVALKAVLMPPPAPAAPGAYDFARQAWFKGLGAVGYAVGPLRQLAAAPAAGLGERLRLWLASQRAALTRRITGAIEAGGLSPGVGAVAAALITAERGPLAPDLLQAYRDAGLAHILVIAGMHMSMVAGLVFVALRSLLAAIPPVALRYPIKKWTAAGALAVTLGYLIISGAPVPTQRAFIMNGMVLLAVLLDRRALSLRSITWAALAVLLLAPEALVGASFQMSFAAVYGLIAGYEALGPALGRWHRAADAWWSKALLYVAGILLTTQIAGTATAFYTVFHFNRYATYSLLGNFLAVPVVGFWIMPAALLAFCLLPFGLDAWGWQAMGWGITVVNRVALWVASLPGATVNLPAVPITALVVFSLGALWLVLWRTPWRLCGLAGMAAGVLLWGLHHPPDLLVEASGRLAAVRTGDGVLAVSSARAARTVREAWAKQAGQGTTAPLWREVEGGDLRCDALGCLFERNGHRVALAHRPEALIEDCETADVVVVAAPVPRLDCPAARLTIDGFALRRQGAHAVWLEDGGLRVETVAGWQGARPWASYRHPAPEAEPDEPPPRGVNVPMMAVPEW